MCRTRIGNFHLNQAFDIETLKDYIETQDIPKVMFNFVYLHLFRIKFYHDKRKLSQFNFDLPEELLADRPAANRDESRLMIVDRKTGTFEHKMFKDLSITLMTVM